MFAEYTTERELLDSLQNGTVDKIWLFDCKAKADFNFMIVDVLDEDYSNLRHPKFGVGIQLTNNTNGDKNFKECLKSSYLQPLKMEAEEKAISGPIKTENVSASTPDISIHGKTDGGLHDYDEPIDVRKHFFIAINMYRTCNVAQRGSVTRFRISSCSEQFAFLKHNHCVQVLC